MKKTSLKFSAKATLPTGFRATGIVAGLKASGKPDMAMFFSDSPAVLAGTYPVNDLAPGATVSVKVKVKVTATTTSTSGAARNVDLTLSSTAGPSAKDKVRVRAVRS